MKLFPYSACSRAVVLLSRFGEALPMVLVDAVGCEVPAVATRLDDERFGKGASRRAETFSRDGVLPECERLVEALLA